MMGLREMTLAEVDKVVRIEQEVHAHPWTRGNFTDALGSGSVCKVYEDGGEILGYVVLMPAVDEIELLDISVAAARQCKGLGRALLEEAMKIARGMAMRRMLLEVRPSNAAALGLYRSAGFREIGRRRGYYRAAPAGGTPPDTHPAGGLGAANGREDAIVMECIL